MPHAYLPYNHKHLSALRQAVQTHTLYKQESRGTEQGSYFPRITQLVKVRARIVTQAF